METPTNVSLVVEGIKASLAMDTHVVLIREAAALLNNVLELLC
jgi:hypothetical protein